MYKSPKSVTKAKRALYLSPTLYVGLGICRLGNLGTRTFCLNWRHGLNWTLDPSAFNARFVALCHYWFVGEWIGFAAEKASEHHVSLDSDNFACTQQEIDVGESIQITSNKEHPCVVVKSNEDDRFESEYKVKDGKDKQKDSDVKSAHGKLHLRFQSFTLVETHTSDLVEHIAIERNCC